MFDNIIKALVPILKEQKYDKNKEKNSLILRLDDIGSNLIKGLMDLYSKYYNPYTGYDEYENHIQDAVYSCLYIFDDILDDEIDLDLIERGTDLFDNDWEDYTYDDVTHFCYREDQESLKEINAGFIVVLGNSIYFSFKTHNDIQLIIEEKKDNLNQLDMSLIYNKEPTYISSANINPDKKRTEQILLILEDALFNFIFALKVFELVFLEIRKEDPDYTFELDDQNIYDRLDKYFDKNSIHYSWIFDEKKSLFNSKHIDCVQDLEAYFRNNDSWISVANQKMIDESIYIDNIDQWLDSVVSTIEGITCSYNNKSTTLIVPPKVRSSIKSIMTYQYSKDKHYSFNISATEVFNKEENIVMHFPVITLLDEENNIIDKNSIKDTNIQKCYTNITDWLKSELIDFGIPIDVIMADIENNNIGIIKDLKKNNIIDNLRMNNANVIVLDKSITDNMGLNEIIKTISDAISGNTDNTDISDLTLDAPKIEERKIPNKSNNIGNNKRNNVIIKNLEFENSIQYSEYIEEKLNPYIDSMVIQFCMHYNNIKQISELFYNFSSMSETEYYNKKNIYNNLDFNDFFQGDSFIININYKDILLDSMLVWYGQNNDDKFYIGRIFDKINYSIPRTKDWYRSCCKYSVQNGLNLNLCSYAGIANIDLTGLCKYVFDDKFNRHIFSDAVNIRPGERCKNHKLFEISSYIWSVLSTIFTKKYILEKRYTGEEQYKEFGYLKSFRSFDKMSAVIDALSDLIKENRLDKEVISSTKYIIESYINNQSIFSENDYNFDNGDIVLQLPNGDKLCYYSDLNDKEIIKYYYIKKSRKKYLNKIYDSNKDNGIFSLSIRAFRSDLYEDSDYLSGIILIQNIQDNNKFLEDILKVFKYLEYDFDNIIDREDGE